MKVKVVRTELATGERKDGTEFIGSRTVVIFPDGMTAAKLFIPDEVIDPDEIVIGGVYDMYRDENKFVLVFDFIPPKNA